MIIKKKPSGMGATRQRGKENTKILFYDFIRINGYRQCDSLQGALPMYPTDICRSGGTCCFRRDNNVCSALSDTRFKDHICRFRKVYREGKNLYDAGEKVLGASPKRTRGLIEILRADGLTVEEIGKALGLSEATVKRHLTLC